MFQINEILINPGQKWTWLVLLIKRHRLLISSIKDVYLCSQYITFDYFCYVGGHTIALVHMFTILATIHVGVLFYARGSWTYFLLEVCRKCKTKSRMIQCDKSRKRDNQCQSSKLLHSINRCNDFVYYIWECI